MIRLGILGSTRGTNLTAIQEAIAQQKCHARIQVVISNRKDALILEKAKNVNLTHLFIDPTGLTREAYDDVLSLQLKKHDVDLIVLIGYMRILSPRFVATWKEQILNVHPSLLPKHAGLMDLAVHQAVISAGDKETGCTVHVVTDVVDQGRIVVQKRCAVLSSDTAEILKQRVQSLEGEALIESINLCA